MRLALLLLVAVMLSGCTITIDKSNAATESPPPPEPESEGETEQQEPQGSGEPSPQISFTKSTAESETVWTVTKVSNGPVAWADLEIYCDGSENASGGSPREGDVKAGNKITCPHGDTLTIYHTPSGALLYDRS